MEFRIDKGNIQKILPLIILAAAILIFLILLLIRAFPSSGELTEKTWPVSVFVIKEGTYTPNITLYGRVESPQTTTLTAAIEADVHATPVEEGHDIKHGDIIIALDQREAKLVVKQNAAQVARLKAQIQSAEITFKADQNALKHEEELINLLKHPISRQKELLKTKYSSEQDLERAQENLERQSITLISRQLAVDTYQYRLAELNAELERAEAEEGQSKIDFQRTHITAPYNGRLTKRFVAVGNRVQKGQKLAELYNTNAVEVRAQIPTHQVAIVKQALASNTTLHAGTVAHGLSISLSLDRLASKIDRGHGGVDALFTVDENSDYLTLGHSLKINLDLSPKSNAFIIPLSALYPNDYVYRIKQDRIDSIAVKRIGIKTNLNIINQNGNSFAIIISPALKTGDEILSTQLPNARSGLKVEIIKKEAQRNHD